MYVRLLYIQSYDSNNDQYLKKKKNSMGLKFKMLYDFDWKHSVSYAKMMIFVKI